LNPRVARHTSILVGILFVMGCTPHEPEPRTVVVVVATVPSSTVDAAVVPVASAEPAAPESTPPMVPTPEPPRAPRVANFGQSLEVGLYVFGDGLELEVSKLYECDFDPTDPCPIGGTYRLAASLRGKRADVNTKVKRTVILGHTVDIIGGHFVVHP